MYLLLRKGLFSFSFSPPTLLFFYITPFCPLIRSFIAPRKNDIPIPGTLPLGYLQFRILVRRSLLFLILLILSFFVWSWCDLIPRPVPLVHFLLLYEIWKSPGKSRSRIPLIL